MQCSTNSFEKQVMHACRPLASASWVDGIVLFCGYSAHIRELPAAKGTGHPTALDIDIQTAITESRHVAMNNADDNNWHIDPDALREYYALSGIQALSEDGAIRIEPTFGEAEGFREVYTLAEGFQLVTGDIQCHKEAILHMKSDGTLKFHYRLEGFSGWQIPDRDEQRITRYSMGVLLAPPGVEKSEHYLEGEHERSVTLICEADFLRERFGDSAEQLPDALARYIISGEVSQFNDRLAMSTEAITAATTILDNPFHGKMRRQYIEARAQELLVLSLAACAENEREEHKVNRGLNSRDVQRMQKARAVLEQEYITPPTIHQLARALGLNEAKLMRDFKQLFGQTIFDFTQNIRMDAAKTLLETTSKSITEIAFDVGYEYSSNFTTAFKRRFGVPPSVARESAKHSSAP